jgi:hypothetical protein
MLSGMACAAGAPFRGEWTMSMSSGATLTLALLLAAIARPAAAASPADAEPSLEAVYAATERFKDVKVALAEGYVAPPGATCEDATHMGKPATLGAMGVHYFRPDLLGITAPPNPRVNGSGTHTDFSKPAILIYEPQADGSLQLVAVENLVFEKAWKAAGHAAPPKFQGVSYQRMADDPATPADEAHMFEPHYDLHVWLYRDNPNGMFSPFNPKVSCKKQPASVAQGHQH